MLGLSDVRDMHGDGWDVCGEFSGAWVGFRRATTAMGTGDEVCMATVQCEGSTCDTEWGVLGCWVAA